MMRKQIALLIALVLALTLGMSTTTFAETNDVADDLQMVNSYLTGLGYSPMDEGAINIMKNMYRTGEDTSNWDDLKNFVLTGQQPEGYIVIVEDGCITIRTPFIDIPSNEVVEPIGITPCNDYTMISKSYDPVTSSLTIANSEYLGAYQGLFTALVSITTQQSPSASFSVSISCPENNVNILQTYVNGALQNVPVSKSYQLCSNPKAGYWTFRVTCEARPGSAISGSIIRTV